VLKYIFWSLFRSQHGTWFRGEHLAVDHMQLLIVSCTRRTNVWPVYADELFLYAYYWQAFLLVHSGHWCVGPQWTLSTVDQCGWPLWTRFTGRALHG